MLALKQLGILDHVKLMYKPSRAGRKFTDLITRQEVWQFGMSTQYSQQIPNIGDNSFIRANLEFVSTDTTGKQRNQLFYQSINKVVEKLFRELYIQ